MIRTITKGIFQSDIVIRTAIMAGLRELQEKPWLLDFAFAWLPSDDLTKLDVHYGEDGVAQAKNWFQSNEIVVTMDYRVDRPQLPCIGIELLDSVEAQATLGDTHYETSEEIPVNEVIVTPNVVVGPFTPKTYDSATGVVLLPDALTTSQVFPGMILFDATINKGFPISEVTGSNTFTVASGTRANFTRALIAPRDNFMIVPLKSLLFRETYRLTCYTNSNSAHLLFLHSILIFILLRNKEKLLEGRGFENFTISSAGIGAVNADDSQLLFSRSSTVAGQVRHYWPGEPSKKLDGIIVEPIRVIDGNRTPPGIQVQVQNQGWNMEGDGIGA